MHPKSPFAQIILHTLFFTIFVFFGFFLLQDVQEVKKMWACLGSVPLSRCGHRRAI